LSFTTSGITTYILNDKVKKNEIGIAYSTYWREEGCMEGYGGETRRKESTRKA
jgi:hypothetical protein